MLISNIVIVL